MSAADNPHLAPRTKAECLEQAKKWGSHFSHLNIMMGVEEGHERRQETLVRTCEADAVEVSRLAALWQMLPVDPPDQDLSDSGDRIGELEEALMLLSVARGDWEENNEPSEEEHQQIERFFSEGWLHIVDGSVGATEVDLTFEGLEHVRDIRCDGPQTRAIAARRREEQA